MLVGGREDRGRQGSAPRETPAAAWSIPSSERSGCSPPGRCSREGRRCVDPDMEEHLNKKSRKAKGRGCAPRLGRTPRGAPAFTDPLCLCLWGRRRPAAGLPRGVGEGLDSVVLRSFGLLEPLETNLRHF